MAEVTQFVFGPFRIDIADRRLWNEQRAVKLTPLAFTLLAHLVKNPGRLVTKNELLRAISRPESPDETLYGLMREVRKALGDDRHESHFIETVPSEGYRFIASVPTQGSGAESKPNSNPPSPTPAAISDTWQVPPSFVGREAELQQLHKLLDKALAGERQIAFLAGEPGVGKTTLARAFLKEVAAAGLASVGRGQCIEQYGAGEAYLPVLEAIGRLCRSPGGEFIPQWLQQHAPTWLIQLPSFLEAADYEVLQRQLQGTTRERMLRELLEAVELLTRQYPLVLLFEDLHWSDYSTLGLLSALARRSEQARLLVIGTYRSAEGLADGHPLRAVLQELRSHGQCSALDLKGLQPADIEQYLTKRFPTSVLPSRLAYVFQQRTEGNPLFLVNLLNDLIEQKLLVEGDGGWFFQGRLETIATQTPETSRQVIVKQMERITPQAAQVLEAASVAGVEFSTSAVAAALQTEVDEIEQICNTLVRREEFLRRAGISEWPDGTQAAQFAFRHALYQELWHERVPMQRRQRFHLQIGERLEQAYNTRASEIAAELAVHWEEGRDYYRALRYRTQAAENALKRYANQEAIVHLTKGLETLASLPESPERTQQELRLRSILVIALQTNQGYGNPAVAQAYARAQELSQKVQEPSQLFLVLYGLYPFHLARGEHTIAGELTEQMVGLAQNAQDPALRVVAHSTRGVNAFFRGELITARTQLNYSLSLYDPQHQAYTVTYGQDPCVACQAFLSEVLWLLGYPKQAHETATKSLATAESLAHPFSLAAALYSSTMVAQFCRDGASAHQYAQATITLANEKGFPVWAAGATILSGGSLVMQGKREEGIAKMHEGLAARQTIGTEMRGPYHKARLAEAYGQVNRIEEGLTLLEEGLAFATHSGERWWEPELYRLQGELTLRRVKTQDLRSSPRKAVEKKAEEYFQRALNTAQQQSAKSLELRAATSLSRLWKKQGKSALAEEVLAKVYNWFEEGLETVDLQEAQALLTTFR